MNNIKKRINATFLIVCILLAVIFGSTQRSHAGSYYDNYYNYYQYYLGYYNATGNYNTYYLGFALPYYYWYLAGYYGDNYGYNYDPQGSKSDKHISSSYYSSSTYHDIYYNYYASVGDYYWRTY